MCEKNKQILLLSIFSLFIMNVNARSEKGQYQTNFPTYSMTIRYNDTLNFTSGFTKKYDLITGSAKNKKKSEYLEMALAHSKSGVSLLFIHSNKINFRINDLTPPLRDLLKIGFRYVYQGKSTRHFIDDEYAILVPPIGWEIIDLALNSTDCQINYGINFNWQEFSEE